MEAKKTMIPSSSQTVGPYFRIGQGYLIDRMAELDPSADGNVEIGGAVLDRDGLGVPDAMLEFWSAVPAARGQQENGIPERFRRVATNDLGNFQVKIRKPVAMKLEDGRIQSPYLMVLVFARGLQRHLISRVYLEGETANEGDPVLQSLPSERRRSLIAKAMGDTRFRWNVILQGAEETVFFAW
jgi:protocatechuate 3,4-dioxygenase alpha subunit